MNFLKINRYWILLSLIILLGLELRLWHYPSFPATVETADERAWAWLGASLIQKRQPTSWSLFPAYQKNFIYQKLNNHAPLVRPFLDHPPLFALIPGSMHLLQAKNWQVWPSQKAVRAPMIVLGSLNIFLLGLLLKLYFPKQKDEALNLVTSLVFASLPLIVFTSRLAVADNLLATWALIVLIAAKKRLTWLIYLTIVLAGLTKVQGLFIGGGVFVYAWILKDKKLILGSVLALITALASFFAYGSFYNTSLFLKIFFDQGDRKIGLVTLAHRFFFQPNLVSHLWPTLTKPLIFLAGLLVLAKASIDKRSNLLLPASLILSFLVLTLLAVDEVNINAWYDYAIYPIMFIGIKLVLDYLRDHPSPLVNITFWFILILPHVRLLAASLLNTAIITPTLTRSITLAPLIPLAKPKSYRLQQLTGYLFLSLFILVNIFVILALNQQTYSDLVWNLTHY